MNARKWVFWIAAGFCLWYLLTQPTGAAHAVNSAVGGLATAADSLATFVNTLGE